MTIGDETMGPVEFALLEFPDASFDGSIASALKDVVDREIVHIIDLLMVSKDSEGEIQVVELANAEAVVAEHFDDLDGEIMWLLSDEDVAAAAATMQLGSTGVLVVWENTWARNLKGAVRRANGGLVIHDRLDSEAVIAAMEAPAGA